MSKEAMKLTQMMDALIQKYSDKLYDGTGAKAANDFELDVAAIRLTLAEQPAPAAREWVGLTNEQIEREWQFMHDEEGNSPDHHDFARAIEAANNIKEKNR